MELNAEGRGTKVETRPRQWWSRSFPGAPFSPVVATKSPFTVHFLLPSMPKRSKTDNDSSIPERFSLFEHDF